MKTRRIYMDVSEKCADQIRTLAFEMKISQKRVIEEIVNKLATTKQLQSNIRTSIKK